MTGRELCSGKLTECAGRWLKFASVLAMPAPDAALLLGTHWLT